MPVLTAAPPRHATPRTAAACPAPPRLTAAFGSSLLTAQRVSHPVQTNCMRASPLLVLLLLLLLLLLQWQGFSLAAGGRRGVAGRGGA